MRATAARPSLVALALRFLRLGFLAWGGPVVQIAALHDELVARERWADEAQFRRALAVYQALPGPEATEMCIWFGTISRGRLGGLVAGLGFVLPGLLLMLLASCLLFGLEPWPGWLSAAFAGLQAAVVALVARAAWRLFGVSCHRDPLLYGIAIASASGARAGTPFAASLLAGGVVAGAARLGRRPSLGKAARRSVRAAVAAVVLAWLVVGALHHGGTGLASLDGVPAGPHPRLTEVFLVGLRAGLLTFGGAYTAIPFLQADAVGPAGWMTNAEFLSGLAVGGAIPAPMVIVGTWVGWAGAGLPGALLLTLGIFLPAFAFPLLLHDRLERLVRDERLHAVLDGVTAAVAGLVAAVAIGLVATLASPLPIAIAAGALAALFLLRHRLAVLAVLGAAAAVATVAR